MQTHPLVDRECFVVPNGRLAGRKVLVAPPLDRREARNIWEPRKPVNSGFDSSFPRRFTKCCGWLACLLPPRLLTAHERYETTAR